MNCRWHLSPVWFDNNFMFHTLVKTPVQHKFISMVWTCRGYPAAQVFMQFAKAIVYWFSEAYGCWAKAVCYPQTPRALVHLLVPLFWWRLKVLKSCPPQKRQIPSLHQILSSHEKQCTNETVVDSKRDKLFFSRINQDGTNQVVNMTCFLQRDGRTNVTVNHWRNATSGRRLQFQDQAMKGDFFPIPWRVCSDSSQLAGRSWASSDLFSFSAPDKLPTTRGWSRGRDESNLQFVLSFSCIFWFFIHSFICSIVGKLVHWLIHSVIPSFRTKNTTTQTFCRTLSSGWLGRTNKFVHVSFVLFFASHARQPSVRTTAQTQTL